MEIERHIHQPDHNRDLDQRADDPRERLPGGHPPYPDADGDRRRGARGQNACKAGATNAALLAVAILAKLGYEVVAATGKSGEKDFLTRLGAKTIITREEITRLPVHSIADVPTEKGVAVFLIDDADLVAAVELARANHLRLGREFGILSYNDTPVKRVIDRGITVLSTDFAKQGRRAAAALWGVHPGAFHRGP